MKTLMRGAAIGLALALGAQVAQAQAGLSLGLGAGALYAEGRFHAIFKGGFDSQSLEETTAYMIPLTVGLRWSLR